MTSFWAISKTFVNLISSVRFLWLRMHALRNSVILRGMFCMRFNRKKRKKEKKENRRKGIKITSVVNIWKSYIWTAVKDVNMKAILSSGFIWNQHSDQLPLGLLAQLKSTAPVSQRSWVQIPYRPSFHYDLIQKLHRNRLVGVPIVLV